MASNAVEFSYVYYLHFIFMFIITRELPLPSNNKMYFFCYLKVGGNSFSCSIKRILYIFLIVKVKLII